MAVPFFASTRRVLTWCFLAAVAVASIEALGFLTINAGPALTLFEFAQRFVNTSGIVTVILLGLWLPVWFLMVWLGGIRPGIALFFLLSFFMLFAYLLVVVDLLLALTARFADDRSMLLMDSFYLALILSTLASLILGKLSRRRSITVTPRTCTILVTLLAGIAFATWARGVPFAPMQTAAYWGAVAAAALAVSLLLWWLGRSPVRMRFTLAGLSLAVFIPLPCTLPTAPPPAKTAAVPVSNGHPVKHIILITVDTLRRDALGCYNPAVSTTPNIDQFARDGAIFTNAFSSAPWTYPSVASILTGLPPRIHQLTDGKTSLPDNTPTMAGALANAGYQTAALGFNGLLLPLSKLDTGFREYYWYPMEALAFPNFEAGITHHLLNLSTTLKPTATILTDFASLWLKQHARQDSFFWLHYFDPHMPYMPPDEFQPADPKQRAMGPQFWDVKPARGGTIARTPEERAWIKALYDGEVAYLDREIGRLFDYLRKSGIYDDALIILTADHGEEFWDHDRFEHGHTLFNELVRVPFLIKPPKSHAPATIEAPVPTQAIMPTVLDLCAVPTDNPALLPPLSPLLTGTGTYLQQPLYTGAALFHDHLEGVIFDDMKYIRATVSGHEQLYNLKVDPGEHDSLATRDLPSLEKGRQLLDAAMEADPKLAEQMGIRHDDKNHLNQQDVIKLQALGYL